jgi:ribonuclease HII
VVAAAVIVTPDLRLRGVDDSKKLSAARREELFERICAEAVAVGVGFVDVEDVDRLNVYHAALEAMRRAVLALPVAPDHVVVDARTIPGVLIPQTPLVNGDARSYIVAKVRRDRLMCELHRLYPLYAFDRNMGYGTAEHLAAIDRHGPSPIHRRSFTPVRQKRLPGV